MLDSLGSSLRKTIMKIRGAPIVDEKLINELMKDLENALLGADVNLDLTLNMCDEVRNKALKDNIPPGLSRRDYTLKVIYDELTYLLGKKHAPLQLNPNEKSVLLLIGIQGSGKTTAIGKLANYFQKRGFKIGVIGAESARVSLLTSVMRSSEMVSGSLKTA